MWAHKDNIFEPGHKSFIKTQKPMIKGYCRARMRAELPEIWHGIEKWKNNKGL